MLLDLDLAGVDLIIPDLSRSWTECGALICEINARPEIGRNTTPTIHDRMLDELLGRLLDELLDDVLGRLALGRSPPRRPSQSRTRWSISSRSM